MCHSIGGFSCRSETKCNPQHTIARVELGLFDIKKKIIDNFQPISFDMIDYPYVECILTFFSPSLPQTAADREALAARTFGDLSPSMQEDVRCLLRDQRYQGLAKLASGNFLVMSDDYVDLYSDAEDPSNRRSGLARMLCTQKIPHRTMNLKTLFGLTHVDGIPLERVLQKSDVDGSRLRGRAQTHLLSSIDMLLLILRCKRGQGALRGLVAAERVAHSMLVNMTGAAHHPVPTAPSVHGTSDFSTRTAFIQ